MQNVWDDINLAFRQGDKSAFDALYNQLSDQLITYCKNFVGFEDAQDIAAETFYKLWRTKETWGSISNVKSFLYVSAKNSCLNLLKHQKVKAVNHKNIAALIANEQKAVLLSEIESELISQILVEIESLPANCKAVFKMSYLDGYETNEIAERLNLTTRTVFNLRSIALKAIKTAIFKRGLPINMLALMVEIANRL
ncbi:MULTISPECIES: RNA polymerase sigma factor [Niastella]|uniref:Sigma-70 family RNA polymerase sigma factor n=1 Tax=Niastella soli TaxID=2821487 RepID=A0ABS3YZ81_9BACT|nr:sigma-70 family RNA polymerase sigma factor [Niastella soli]MBO9202812.1 sigma-70 family RNA polymerase sigma factor [Niastella soli]